VLSSPDGGHGVALEAEAFEPVWRIADTMRSAFARLREDLRAAASAAGGPAAAARLPRLRVRQLALGSSPGSQELSVPRQSAAETSAYEAGVGGGNARRGPSALGDGVPLAPRLPDAHVWRRSTCRGQDVRVDVQRQRKVPILVLSCPSSFLWGGLVGGPRRHSAGFAPRFWSERTSGEVRGVAV
ncbi:unnamed protein product, partial [Prorocentrum cordatum]